MTRDSEKALGTIRRARRHVQRPAVVQASNGMEEALAIQSARRWLDARFWKISCPLPNGGEIYQLYDRTTGEHVGGGYSSPYSDIGLDAILEGR